MKFIVDKKLFDLIPDVCFGVIIARDIDNSKDFPDNPIQINILHFKKDSPCFFCKKTYEESQFCLLENLLKKQYTISQLTKGFKDEQIILAADSKNFSVKKCFYKRVFEGYKGGKNVYF